MNADDRDAADQGTPLRECPPTNWGMVELARAADEHTRIQALNTLIAIYYPVLLQYLKIQFRLSATDAADYLQAFLLDKLIKKQIIQGATQDRGKFRYFLMRSVSRYVLDGIRRKKAAKRSPNEMTIPFEDWLESPHNEAAAVENSAAFDAEFARFVVTRALKRMEERCAANGEDRLWALFHEKILGVAFEDTQPLPNDRLVSLLGLRNKREVFSLVVKAKRRFAEILHEVLGEFVTHDHVESEIRSLRATLMNL